MILKSKLTALEHYFLKAYDHEDIRLIWRLRFALYSALSIVSAVTIGAAIASLILPLPRLFLVAAPILGISVLLLLRKAVKPGIVFDLLLAAFFSMLAFINLSGASAPIIMWFLVFPLLAALLRGAFGGFYWTILASLYFIWQFAFRWSTPEGMSTMPDLFRHTWPLSIPIAFITLLTFLGIGIFADGATGAAMDKAAERNRALGEENVLRKKAEENLSASLLVRDRLLAVMSHDLTNPIGAIQSLMSGVEDGSDPLSQEILVEIKHSVNRVYVMLENLLVWSKSQVGTVQAAAIPQDCAKTIAEEVDFQKPAASAKDIAITLLGCDSPWLAVLDAQLLRIVTRNLLQNAIKYSPQSAIVEVELTIQDGISILEIRDRGTGLPKGVFEELLGGASVSSTFGTKGEHGHGIGLSVCIKLMSASGGSLCAAARPGGGTSFTARFGETLAMSG